MSTLSIADQVKEYQRQAQLMGEEPTLPKYTEDAEGNWMCQGCKVWYPPRYLCSNEVTRRLECMGCLLHWRDSPWQHHPGEDEDTNDYHADYDPDDRDPFDDV